MQCVLSDKETINGAEPAKGIKSTHARPLFKLIKGPPLFFWRGQVYSYNKGDRLRSRKQSWHLCFAGKSLTSIDQGRRGVCDREGVHVHVHVAVSTVF